METTCNNVARHTEGVKVGFTTRRQSNLRQIKILFIFSIIVRIFKQNLFNVLKKFSVINYFLPVIKSYRIFLIFCLNQYSVQMTTDIR